MTRPAGGVADVLPLSPLQEGMVFHALLDTEGRDPYTVRARIDMDGDFDPATFRAAVDALLVRHPNLRAGFVTEGTNQPVQVVPRRTETPVREVDLAGLPAKERRRALSDLLAAEQDVRFTLSAPPLLRFTVVRGAPGKWLLLFAAHHILLDGWSVPLLFGELFALYRSGGDASGLPPVTPFREFLGWLKRQGPRRRPGRLAGGAGGGRGADPARAGAGRPGRRAAGGHRRGAGRAADSGAGRARAVLRLHSQHRRPGSLGGAALRVDRAVGRRVRHHGVGPAGRAARGRVDDRAVHQHPAGSGGRPAGRDRAGAVDPGWPQSRSGSCRTSILGLAEIQRAAEQTDLFDSLVVFENYPLQADGIADALPGRDHHRRRRRRRDALPGHAGRRPGPGPVLPAQRPRRRGVPDRGRAAAAPAAGRADRDGDPRRSARWPTSTCSPAPSGSGSSPTGTPPTTRCRTPP